MPDSIRVPDPVVVAHVGDWQACAADFVLAPVLEGEDASTLGSLDAATDGDIARSLLSREFKPKPYEVYATRLKGLAPRLLCVGAGPRPSLTPERMRKVAAAAAWAARHRGATRLAWLVRSGIGEFQDLVQPAVDGLVSAAVGPDRRKSDNGLSPLDVVAICSLPGADLRDAVTRGAVHGRAANLARWLSDEPANVLTPSRFAEHTVGLFAGTSVTVDVLDESHMNALGMGLLLGVAQGSAARPRLLVLRYRPDTATRPSKVLAMVGKGVTFDSGGLSLKPADGMEKMKHDMGGAAAVIAAMRAVSELRPSIEVLGLAPCVENMPSGTAIRPGDILTSAAGKTVEVLNTDAEGRLILADALWYARQQGATHIIDVATLTGACMVALGRICSGLFGQPDPWIDTVQHTAARVGERVWRLPCDDDYKDLLKSDSADMTNTGGRYGGAIGGAMFLKAFVEDTPWAHLDVAGTAWADDPKPWQPKGATGVAVRTLIELACQAQGSERSAAL